MFSPTDVTLCALDRQFSLVPVCLFVVLALACGSNTSREKPDSAPVVAPLAAPASVPSATSTSDLQADAHASLLKAASIGDVGLLARLLALPGADVNYADAADDWTPLHAAVANGHMAAVSLLLSRGARIDAVTRVNRWTPLHVAAHFGRVEIALTLLDKGADDLAGDSVGRYPGNVAADAGYLDLGLTIFEMGKVRTEQRIAVLEGRIATNPTSRYLGTSHDGEIFVPESFGSVFAKGSINAPLRGDGLQIDATSVASFAGEYEMSYVIANVGTETISIESTDHVVYARRGRVLEAYQRLIPLRLVPMQDELVQVTLGRTEIPHQIVLRVRHVDGHMSVFAIQGLARAVCERDVRPSFDDFEKARSLCVTDSR